eukprot:NODE_11_length_46995_cov_0.451872.p21 type:complete len:188 gc:universal NODE_11_length_46995_cov_0.451872:30060-29497(-)
MTKNHFNVVVACTLNSCIGSNNTLPWPHLKSDLQWLSKLTTTSESQNAIIMGRLTWESLPKRPLKDRINIIVSTTMDNQDVQNYKDSFVAPDFDAALELSRKLLVDQIFCLGGAKLYSHAFKHPECKHIFMTRLNYVVEGDAYLDPSQLRPFKKLSDQEFIQVVPFVKVESIIEKGISYNFECWERV